jgi:hypothetical protein
MPLLSPLPLLNRDNPRDGVVDGFNRLVHLWRRGARLGGDEDKPKELAISN